MKLKKGDKIEVVRGKDKGKTGDIEKVFPERKKVLMQGINMVKRHVKKRMQGQKSEIITMPKPIAEASVMLVCPKCKLKTRVGFSFEKDKKMRICKRCEKQI